VRPVTEPPEAEMPVMLRQQHILQNEIKKYSNQKIQGFGSVLLL